MPHLSKKSASPLESYIEKKICQHAKATGVIVYKFTSPNQRSVTDRIFIAPGGVVGFLEIKRKGQVPTKLQTIEHAKLKQQGCHVMWVDNIFDGKSFVDMLRLKGMPTRVEEKPMGGWMVPVKTQPIKLW